MATLYIMVGIPGSGKSTYSKKLNAIHVSSDAIRKELFGTEDTNENPQKVFGILNHRVKKALKEGKDVIYDATNVGRSTRKKIIKNFKDNADNIVACYFDIPSEVAKERNASRERKVPEEVIDRMYSNLKVPSLDEGFNKIVHIKTIVENNKIVETITEESS